MSGTDENCPLPAQIAAVDLGSNSFHMVVARVVDGEPVVIDGRREMVRLAAGLDDGRRLDDAARDRAMACLERFGQSLGKLPRSAVRAVGTNTLRSARNARAFLADAERALGHRVEVISGREEARLIYLGVAHTLADDTSRRLVIDIGGGSTELILGERFEAQRVESLFMGCVTFAKAYFADGRITQKAMDKAVLAAKLELQSFASVYRRLGWQSAVGSSGTIRTTASVIQAKGWSKCAITQKSLRSLHKVMVEAGHHDKLDLPGLKPERAPVFASGVAIVTAAMESLEIDQLGTSPGALREGVLYEILGRVTHEDVRGRSISLFQSRYSVDPTQAERVERTALMLFGRSGSAREIELDEAERFLAWAARIHEVGMAVTHRHYHRHGAYLVANSDLPGFSADEQALLAFLVRAQRRRFPMGELDSLRPGVRDATTRLALLLRLAVLFHRGHAPEELPPLEIRWSDRDLVVTIPPGWLDEHSLTAMDLEQEAAWLGRCAFNLVVTQRAAAPGPD